MVRRHWTDHIAQARTVVADDASRETQTEGRMTKPKPEKPLTCFYGVDWLAHFPPPMGTKHPGVVACPPCEQGTP